MSGSSTASSDTSMTGRVRLEDDFIASAAIYDVSAADHTANMGPPTGRPTGGAAVHMPTSSESGPMLGSEQDILNNHVHARYRKRRLTSNGDASRLQRTRSGGAIRPEGNANAALPLRSVSMIMPTSRNTNSKAPGSSYATAIDITSSPSDDGRHSSIDRGDAVHGPFGGSSSFRRLSNPLYAGDHEPLPTRISSRRPLDPRADNSRHTFLSSGASSMSRAPEGSNDRPSYQTWHSASEAAAEADILTNSNDNIGRRPLPWDPQPRRSSQGSSRSARSSHIEENLHPHFLGQHVGGGYRNRGSDTSRSTIIPTPGVEGDMWRTHTRANTLNSSSFTANGERNIENFGWRPERRVAAPERRVFSASIGEVSRARVDNNDRGYDRYPEYQDLDMPRWQPDAEVTSCPICGTVFSFWYRKHHCRKCGRVVCASCSPHSIVIPRQFIVRPPDTPTSHPESSPTSHTPVVDLTGDDSDLFNSSINPALGGGEKVRLCNPCVPDPNPNPLGYGSPRAHGHRSTHSLTSSMGNNTSRIVVSFYSTLPCGYLMKSLD